MRLGHERRRLVTRYSWIGMAAGLLGAAIGIKDMVVGPRVEATQLSYPAAPEEVWWTACLLALTHAGAAAAVLGVRASSATASRAARLSLGAAAAGFAVMVPAELAYIRYAEATVDSTAGGAISGVMGAAAMAAGVGLTVAGVDALRRGGWSGWRRPVILITGVWPVAVLTPVFLTSGWAAWPLVGWQTLLTTMSVAALVETPALTVSAAPSSVRPGA